MEKSVENMPEKYTYVLFLETMTILQELILQLKGKSKYKQTS